MIKMPLTGKAQERCTWPTRVTEVGALSVPLPGWAAGLRSSASSVSFPRGVREGDVLPARGLRAGRELGTGGLPPPGPPQTPGPGGRGRRLCSLSARSQAAVGGGQRDNGRV